MPHYHFLPEDIEALNKAIEKLDEEAGRLGKITNEIKNSGSTEGGLELQEVFRQLELVNTRRSELNDIRRNAKVAHAIQSNERVALGKTVTIMDADTEEVRTFTIGSYRNFDKKNVFSYDAPLCKIIMGAKVGERREGKIINDTRTFEVISIE